MKLHTITISGIPGSGKSSTADTVAMRLGYSRFSSGDFMRKLAQSRGVSVDGLRALAEQDHTIDQQIDTEVQRVGLSGNIVIDSRLGYHFLPDSFKVFLSLDPETSAQRAVEHLVQVGAPADDGQLLRDTLQKITDRIASEKQRHLATYGVDFTNAANYDLIVDTNAHSLDETVEMILAAYNVWSNERQQPPTPTGTPLA